MHYQQNQSKILTRLEALEFWSSWSCGKNTTQPNPHY